MKKQPENEKFYSRITFFWGKFSTFLKNGSKIQYFLCKKKPENEKC